MRGLLVAALIGAATFAAPASAAEYFGSSQFAEGRVDYSVVTDGTLGLLSGSNITAFRVALQVVDGGGQTLTGTFDENSGFFNTFNGLSADQSNLSFNYDGGGFGYFGTFDGATGFCIEGGSGVCGGIPTGQSINFNGAGATPRSISGVQTFAGPAAPGPIVGLGLLPALAALGGLVFTRRAKRPTLAAA